MKTEPVINEIYTEEELLTQTENMQKWVNLFKKISDISKIHQGGGLFDLCIYQNPHLTGIDAKDIEPMEYPNIYGDAFFIVQIGWHKTVEILFHSDCCTILTWFDGTGFEGDEFFVKKFNRFLKEIDVSRFKCLNDCKLSMNGVGIPEKISLDDGLFVLKKWIEFITPEMKKQNVEF